MKDENPDFVTLTFVMGVNSKGMDIIGNQLIRGGKGQFRINLSLLKYQNVFLYVLKIS